MVHYFSKYSGKCSCGRTHDLVTRAAVIEPGCLRDFEKYMKEFGITGKRCALYGENGYRATADRHPFAQQEIILNPNGLHANEISTAEVLAKLEKDVEIIIAVGSGTIHDIARFCAHEADTDIIKNAPIELVRSGVGDIAAKYTALCDWKIATAVTGEYFCQRIHDLMAEATDTVMKSVPGIVAGEDEAYSNITYALLLSGIAMQMIGNSRPASGCEHHISHLIEMEPEKLNVRFPAMHGEKTGVASVYGIKEYKRLAEIEDITPYLSEYVPFPKDDLCEFLGEKLAPAILEENEKDCLSAVSKENLAKAWPTIRKLIGELPEPDYLDGLLVQLGAKHRLEEIGVTEEDKDTLLKYSPMVRNRLTLMRMKRMISC